MNYNTIAAAALIIVRWKIRDILICREQLTCLIPHMPAQDIIRIVSWNKIPIVKLWAHTKTKLHQNDHEPKANTLKWQQLSIRNAGNHSHNSVDPLIQAYHGLLLYKMYQLLSTVLQYNLRMLQFGWSWSEGWWPWRKLIDNVMWDWRLNLMSLSGYNVAAGLLRQRNWLTAAAAVGTTTSF